MTSYTPIAVGTDGSDSANRAVRKAADVAATTGATLLIVCAYRPESRETVREGEDALGEDVFNLVGSSPAVETLSRAQQSVQDAGLTSVETVAVEGDPVESLVDIARRRNADLDSVSAFFPPREKPLRPTEQPSGLTERRAHR